MNKLKTILVLIAASLFVTPAHSQMDGPELSGEIQAARLALPALTQAFCREPEMAAEYQTYCQLTSVKVFKNWALMGWYEGESSGDAIAHFDGKHWQIQYVASPTGTAEAAIAEQVPAEIAQTLLPDSESERE